MFEYICVQHSVSLSGMLLLIEVVLTVNGSLVESIFFVFCSHAENAPAVGQGTSNQNLVSYPEYLPFYP